MSFGTIRKLEQEIIQLQINQDLILKRLARIEKTIKVEAEEPVVKVEVPVVELKVIPPKPTQPQKEPTQPTPKFTKDLEFRIGGTWLNRIGVVAVVLGMAFFLKYSFDNDWVGPTGRIILGLLSGGVMMFAGEKLHLRYTGYAQGLIGGGSLAMFFSIYAGYQFYFLIPPFVAFSFMVLIMGYTVFMAVRKDSRAIGILGIIGAYMAPFLVGSEDPSLWLLYAYLTFLTLGVLGISIYKKWVVFQYLSFIFNQLIFAFMWMAVTWGSAYENFVAPSFLFLCTNFFIYLGIISVYNIRTKKKSTRWDISLILMNGFLFFAWSTDVLEYTFLTDLLGFYAVFMALVYLYLGKMAYQLHKEDKGQVYSLFLLAFVLITLAFPIQFSDVYVGLGWLAEAVGLAYMARRLDAPKILKCGMVVLVLGMMATLGELSSIGLADTFLFNSATLLLVVCLTAIYRMVKILTGWEEPSPRIKQVLKGMFLVISFIGLTLENEHFFYLHGTTDYGLSPEQLSLSALWTLFAIGLFAAGIVRKSRYYRYSSLALLAMVVLKAFFIDLGDLATIYKIILFIFLGLSLLGISFLYQRKFREEDGSQ
ncbi:DUF2339 domain-containing protein [Ammoniphilus resinae]|uniref:Membrane protein n=1 Tax=Ammoniphilus resinae TaxID=861532 RepID=A0ABS4GXE4_9BACL|nr:DUF2339 domain-containing protein [Ammoniphilus resinae]MBP1934939.1 putative membrane protein [Ammoniphilus resinae]